MKGIAQLSKETTKETDWIFLIACVMYTVESNDSVSDVSTISSKTVSHAMPRASNEIKNLHLGM